MYAATRASAASVILVVPSASGFAQPAVTASPKSGPPAVKIEVAGTGYQRRNRALDLERQPARNRFLSGGNEWDGLPGVRCFRWHHRTLAERGRQMEMPAAVSGSVCKNSPKGIKNVQSVPHG
jgi:hypothetical protein